MDLLIKLEHIGRIFTPLERCRGVEQMVEHHPEGDVFAHSLQVLRIAFRESQDPELILAAMLHDVGKAVDSHGHEDYALKILGDNITEKTSWLIKNHMRFWYFVLGEMKKLSKVRELAEHKWLGDLTALARWDKCGRKAGAKVVYDRVDIVNRLNSLIVGQTSGVYIERKDNVENAQTLLENPFKIHPESA